ncbi:hypothetical protein TNIN_1751 [Trichonephila inaurata madagascariensis]|uniref:Uncharacterized protein n=1 Tax=Trichonephila inaurata madagascariensis TaxID=2747483 RepID=A0A8X6YL95_9ARAC|nr:hypothetical protein TNIN_1751 [Trichonephila inaurata madagascariensis]
MGTANCTVRFFPPSHSHSLTEQELQRTCGVHGLSCSPTFTAELKKVSCLYNWGDGTSSFPDLNIVELIYLEFLSKNSERHLNRSVCSLFY